MSKLSLAASLLLLIGILPLPYSYYLLLRILIFVIAILIIHFEWTRKTNKYLQFIVLALIFNPVFPVFLTKAIWIPIDLIGAYFFFDYSKKFSNALKQGGFNYFKCLKCNSQNGNNAKFCNNCGEKMEVAKL